MPATRPAKKRAKPVVVKPKTKPRKKAKAPVAKTGRRALDTLGEIFVVRQGATATVLITVDSSIQEVTLTLNGRGVFRGQP